MNFSYRTLAVLVPFSSDLKEKLAAVHPERRSHYINSTAAPSKNGSRPVPRNWKKCGPRWMRKELTMKS